jgi:AraC-like DNA-binding protein
LSERWLSTPVQTANRALLAHLSAHGQKQVRALAPDDTFAGRVMHAIRGALADGPTLESVARSLEGAPRTLQRRLSQEGTSLHELVDRARFERACERLRDPAVGVRAVAIELGFSEQAAFHRAFVRWTGTSPGRWRIENGVR